MPRYKVLVGQHIDNHPSYGGDHVYAEGEVVDTDKDLCRFNAAGMQPKFERLHEDGRMTREEWVASQQASVQEAPRKAAAPTPPLQTPVPAAEQPATREAPVPAPQQPPSYGQRQQGKGR